MFVAGPVSTPPVCVNVLSYTPRLKVRCSSQQSQEHDPSPPRITSNVKQSLKYLKLIKEHNRKSSSGSSPKPATSYRKKRPENVPNGKRSYEDPTLSLYHTNEGIEFETPVLLVDGYNVCGYWPKLKKYFSRGFLETARQKLVHELITFSSVRGVKVVVVFDALLSGLPNHKETIQTIDVVYTGDACADSWIEKEVSSLKADGCPRVWVVSSDTYHQHAAHGAGAYIWNCKVLISEIKDSKKELEDILHDDSMYSMKGKLLEHNLSDEVLDKLSNLKQQLKNTPG